MTGSKYELLRSTSAATTAADITTLPMCCHYAPLTANFSHLSSQTPNGSVAGSFIRSACFVFCSTPNRFVKENSAWIFGARMQLEVAYTICDTKLSPIQNNLYFVDRIHCEMSKILNLPWKCVKTCMNRHQNMCKHGPEHAFVSPKTVDMCCQMWTSVTYAHMFKC